MSITPEQLQQAIQAAAAAAAQQWQEAAAQMQQMQQEIRNSPIAGPGTASLECQPGGPSTARETGVI